MLADNDEWMENVSFTNKVAERFTKSSWLVVM
jgi:hypothetical protein